MKTCFVSYNGDETIPVARYLRNRKLRKYFSRETSVAVVCAAQLLEGESLHPQTPFYYAAGLLAFEEYGLPKLVEASLTDEGRFSAQQFVEMGLAGISPLTSFKCLQNMSLAFISVELGLTGDNAVVSVSAASLLAHARLAPTNSSVLIGAGKADRDGYAAASFALTTGEELIQFPTPAPGTTALSFLRDLSMGAVP